MSTGRLRAVGGGLAVLAWLAAVRAPVRADDPVSSNVTFNREVIRIVQRKCEPCHGSGSLAMPLSDYRDARTWGRAIREELVEHRMPPAMVARGYRRYESDPSLSAREIATFLTWLDGGMPRGDEADRPAATSAADIVDAIEPGRGVRLALPSQVVPARENLVVRRVTVDAAAVAGRAISRVQLRPGNRRLLRGAVLYAGATWIGAWLPWQHAIVPPASNAFHVAAGASLVVELYYRGADVEASDESQLDIAFAPDTATRPIEDVVLEPRDAAGHRLRGRVTLTRQTTVWAIHAAADAGAASMELRAERPDKSFEVLMWVPQVRTDWPLALVLEEPVTLPAGSALSLVVEGKSDAAAESRTRAIVSVLR